LFQPFEERFNLYALVKAQKTLSEVIQLNVSVMINLSGGYIYYFTLLIVIDGFKLLLQELTREAPIIKQVNMQNNLNLKVADRFITFNCFEYLIQKLHQRSF